MMQKNPTKTKNQQQQKQVKSLLAPKVPLAKAISVSSFLAYSSRDGRIHIYIYNIWVKCY